MTNYTYTSGRPAANLSPAAQRSDMQTNNDNNASIWTEDHYGFNDNDGGLHKKSTYPVASDQTSASGQIVIYSKTANSSSELFVRRDNVTSAPGTIQMTSGTATSATGASTNSTANWQTFLPGGLQMKGGRISTGTSGTITYTAEGMTAFPTATLQVQLTPFLQASTNTQVTNITSTTFAWSQTTSGALYWIAIGY